jgi:hypothetical protein
VGQSEDVKILGLGTTLTTDYRSAALQVAYLLTPRDRVVLQFSHRRLGESPIMQFEPNIEMDWAFYQHRFGSFWLRGGRFPLPAGIYNEVRDVGTILPFFRAPYTSYPDGTETVDGIGFTYTALLGDWSIEANGAWGGTELKVVVIQPTTTLPILVRNEETVAGQFWLNTPLDGLRVGVAGMRWEQNARNHLTTQLSLDGDFERFMVRAEYKTRDFDDVDIFTYYGQGGIKLTQRLQLLAQYEVADIETGPTGQRVDQNLLKDGALGVKYSFTPNLVLKLEAHQTRGTLYDEFVNPVGPAAKTRYAIASISASF